MLPLDLRRRTGRTTIPGPANFRALYVDLAHHYVADLLGGVLYGTVAYVIVCSPAARRPAVMARSLHRRLRGQPAVGLVVSPAKVVATTAPVESVGSEPSLAH